MCKIAITNNYASEAKFQNYFNWLKLVDSEVELIQINIEDVNLNYFDFDGFLITGGHDVHPKFYNGKTNHSKITDTKPERDLFEIEIIKFAKNENIPLLGICRGLQICNVAFGGTLWEDLQLEAKKQSHQSIEHTIEVNNDSNLFKILNNKIVNVNSSHHQAANKISENLKISATSPDGVVEAMELKNNNEHPFFIMVQWHPERLKDENSKKIGNAFVAAAKENCSKKILLTKEE